MGGCVAAAESWAAFEKEWAGTLQKYHIECFHMTDFEAYRKAFKEIDRDTHKALIAALLDTMNRHIDICITRLQAVNGQCLGCGYRLAWMVIREQKSHIQE
jgi:hypothetical protein